MLSKNELRKKAKIIRNNLDMMEISAQICNKIEMSEAFQNSTNIMIFFPLNHEVDLTSLLTHNKNFYLPRVNDKELDVCYYELGDELEYSKFKTLEPKTAPITNLDILDTIYIPALMADKNNYRLGYGGGFYDKFLSKLTPRTKKVVVIPECLIIDELPHDSFDIASDFVICE
jgi:5-formyltetrahydrofolate cyclo-ligase